MKITTEENYCISYRGDVKLLIRLLYNLIIVKNTKIFLSSHHGTTIKLLDYDLTIKILFKDWTHTNKGSGKTKIQFVLSDENWQTIITEHGVTDRKQGLKLTLESKKGFIKILVGEGFTIKDAWNENHVGGNVSVVVNEEGDFVGQYSGETEEYLQTKENLINKMSEMADAYTILKK